MVHGCVLTTRLRLPETLQFVTINKVITLRVFLIWRFSYLTAMVKAFSYNCTISPNTTWILFEPATAGESENHWSQKHVLFFLSWSFWETQYRRKAPKIQYDIIILPFSRWRIYLSVCFLNKILITSQNIHILDYFIAIHSTFCSCFAGARRMRVLFILIFLGVLILSSTGENLRKTARKKNKKHGKKYD